VTGAAGQVGSALQRQAQNFEVELLALSSSTLNITDKGAIEQYFAEYSDIGLIINAAAYTAVDAAENDESQATLVNVTGVKHLAEVAQANGIPLFHISTDYVFDGLAHEGGYREDSGVNPQGVYGRTKLEGERVALATLEQLIILRTSWVFGLEGGNFPKTILRLGEERDEIGVVADQTGCPTFADDIAYTLLQLAEGYHAKKVLPWGIYHYSGGEACTWHQLAVFTLESAADLGVIEKCPKIKELKTSEFPTKAQRPQNSVLNCNKILENFQMVALSDWKAGILSLLRSAGVS